jgi:uncharacterized protein (TIGR03435 family)
MLRAALTFFIASSLALASPAASQQPAQLSANLPAFDAATIKPPNPGAPYHKIGEPGGCIFFGGNIKMLVECACNLQDHQIAGGPDWTASQGFEINAVPPENSSSHSIKVRNAEPTPEQRLMLQSLLTDRFAFKFHFETKTGEVYILTRGTKPLQFTPPKDPESDPRAIVVIKQGGIADGEAEGTNTTINYLALSLGQYIQLPVLNQTAIIGSYDYYLPPPYSMWWIASASRSNAGVVKFRPSSSTISNNLRRISSQSSCERTGYLEVIRTIGFCPD